MYHRGKNIHTRYETNGKSAIRHIAKRNTVIVTTTAPILEIILFIIFPPQLSIEISPVLGNLITVIFCY